MTRRDDVIPQLRFTRRSLIQSSRLVLSGVLLTEVLRTRAAAERSGRLGTTTSVIFVTLGGGPSQLETYDPKPDAPAEYRGPFGAIGTAIAGVAFSDLFPRQAAMAERIAVIRSVQHTQASHIAEHIIETGYDLRNPGNSRTGEMPSVGAVISKLRGANPSGIPGYVSLPKPHAYAGPHWLGQQHQFFGVDDDPSQSGFRVGNLSLNPQLDPTRMSDRRALLKSLDEMRRLHDLAGNAKSLDAIGAQALDLITGERARSAFDIERESPALRDRYGRNALGQRMLLARRLVEAGVPFVTVRMGDWDDHDQLAQRIVPRAAQYDTAITALIDDLRDRGLQRNVLVAAMGEFGRTPRVNASGGRDHWPAVNGALLAGEAFRMGQVVGQTDAHGGRVVSAPYPPQSILTMVYRHLGIDPSQTFDDFSGRPRFVLEQRDPVLELL
jgi:hypothetical protein